MQQDVAGQHGTGFVSQQLWTLQQQDSSTVCGLSAVWLQGCYGGKGTTWLACTAHRWPVEVHVVCLHMGRLFAKLSCALNAQAMQGEMSPTPLDHRIKTSSVVQAFPYLHSVTPCLCAPLRSCPRVGNANLAAATALTAPGVDASHTALGNLRYEA